MGSAPRSVTLSYPRAWLSSRIKPNSESEPGPHSLGGYGACLESASMESPQEELHPDAPWRNALVVANPIAGRGHGRQVAREVTAGLERLGVRAELFLTEGPG